MTEYFFDGKTYKDRQGNPKKNPDGSIKQDPGFIIKSEDGKTTLRWVNIIRSKNGLTPIEDETTCPQGVDLSGSYGSHMIVWNGKVFTIVPYDDGLKSHPRRLGADSKNNSRTNGNPMKNEISSEVCNTVSATSKDTTLTTENFIMNDTANTTGGIEAAIPTETDMNMDTAPNDLSSPDSGIESISNEATSQALIVPTSKIVVVTEMAPANTNGDARSSPRLDNLLAQPSDTDDKPKVPGWIRNAIEICKPYWEYYFRINGDNAYYAELPVLELRSGLWRVLPEYRLAHNKIRYQIFRLGIYHNGVPFIWPLKTGINTWNISAAKISQIAVDQWIKMDSDKAAFQYVHHPPPEDMVIPDPQWPKITFDRLLDMAFQERTVDSFNHPALRGARGEILCTLSQ